MLLTKIQSTTCFILRDDRSYDRSQGEDVKKLIQKFAYDLCSTEVKMLLDKLEENGERIALSSFTKDRVLSHGYLHIINHGRFSIAERLAIATKMNELHRAATKIAIVESIFDGQKDERKPYIPGETIPQRMTNPTSMITSEGITKQALKILDSRMAKDYKTPTQTAEAMRQKGLL